ncbi:MAG: archaeosortase/exosortase family protein [Thermoguttaceae bacterium]
MKHTTPVSLTSLLPFRRGVSHGLDVHPWTHSVVRRARFQPDSSLTNVNEGVAGVAHAAPQTATPTPAPAYTPPVTPSAAAPSPHATNHRTAPPSSAASYTTQPTTVYRAPIDATFEWRRLIALVVVLLVGVWAYAPTLGTFLEKWIHVADYSHGILVVPMTVLFLYLRRDTYPGTCKTVAWVGLSPLLIALAMRYFGVWNYNESIENWSIFPWVLGVVWFMYGTRVFRWALPPLSFLVFMIPLPYAFEVAFRQRLQDVAATFAAAILHFLGEPAVQINRIIRIGGEEIGVADACSGLRLAIGIAAVAVAVILLLRRPWWQNIVILVAVAPIALFVNACRIALTAILVTHAPGLVVAIVGTSRSVGGGADYIAGIVMSLFAFVVFFGFIAYIGQVFRAVTIPLAVKPHAS